MTLIDSHAHLTSSAFTSKEVEAMIQRALDSGVESIINIATTNESLKTGLELQKIYPFIKNAAATTPHDVQKEGEFAFDYFEKEALNQQLVAIGETGLDYYYEHSDRICQQTYFIKYLDLAKRTSLPVIIHCREAFKDLLAIIDSHFAQKPFLIHCFTGSIEEAKAVFDRGGMISFSGMVTFKKSLEIQEVARMAPLHSFLIETDTPFLAPVPYRGKVNQPAYVVEVAKMVAHLKGLSLETIATSTLSNTKRFFNI